MLEITPKTYINFNKTQLMTFGSLKNHNNDSNTEKPYLLAFDLNGTFAEGCKEDIAKFNKIKNQHNCKLAYVTGNNKESYAALIESLEKKGLNLPIPDYLVTCNGQFIYENIDGKFALNQKWHAKQQKTNYNRSQVFDTVQKLVSKEIPPSIPKIKTKPELQVENYKENSQAVQVDYNNSIFNMEFLVSPKIKDKLARQTISELKKQGINSKVVNDYLPKEIIDKTTDNVKKLLSSIIDKKGGIYVLNFVAADKADAVNFIKEETKIEKDHIITAGNAFNDTSLAKSGFWFIMVNNADKSFKKFVTNLINKGLNTIKNVNNNGASGVNEGLDQIFDDDKKINTAVSK